MGVLTLTDAFAKYGAELDSKYAFSAIADDGSLVISCWQHKFTIPRKGVLRYTDQLSRWQQPLSPGRELFASHIRKAHSESLPVRLVIVSTRDTASVDAGDDATKLKKAFDIRMGYLGAIASFDGDLYTIDFQEQKSAT
jgi:hypothetical protein